MSDYDPMAAMEKAKDAVAVLTGVKQQFIDAGWDQLHAERATIELLVQSRPKTDT